MQCFRGSVSRNQGDKEHEICIHLSVWVFLRLSQMTHVLKLMTGFFEWIGPDKKCAWQWRLKHHIYEGSSKRVGSQDNYNKGQLKSEWDVTWWGIYVYVRLKTHDLER